jgi:hypothetical protein
MQCRDPMQRIAVLFERDRTCPAMVGELCGDHTEPHGILIILFSPGGTGQRAVRFDSWSETNLSRERPRSLALRTDPVAAGFSASLKHRTLPARPCITTGLAGRWLQWYFADCGSLAPNEVRQATHSVKVSGPHHQRFAFRPTGDDIAI